MPPIFIRRSLRILLTSDAPLPLQVFGLGEGREREDLDPPHLPLGATVGVEWEVIGVLLTLINPHRINTIAA